MKKDQQLGPDGKPCRVCDQFKDWTQSTSKKIKEGEMPCPPDSVELGRHTWTFLHTMAAYYPATPNAEQKLGVQQLLNQFSKLYPCNYCADHLQAYIEKHPPTVENNKALSSWMCIMHNNVNERLGKPQFDCNKVFERWKDGPSGSDKC